MHRFGSLNPNDYGGMPSFLSHVHNRRRENTEAIDDGTLFLCGAGRDSTISSRLAEVGRPLEQGGENQKIQVAVEKFVSDLLKCVGKLEGRFISNVIPSGSFYEGTKVTAPNEFDFMAEIQVLSFRGACKVQWHSAYPGRPLVQPHPFLANTLFSDVISGSYSLSAGSFRNAFEKILLVALDVMDPLPPCWGRSIKIGHKGPSVTLYLTWIGRKYRKLDISIDITPAIKFFHWPQWTDISAATSKSNQRGASFGAAKESYSKTLKDKVTKLGFHVVPVSPLWRASFSVAEMHILKAFSPDSNRLTCYRCAKYFRDQHKGDSAVLTSYILKTAFLFELEKFPEERFWSNDQLFARLYGMMNRLHHESKEEVLGSYFVSSFSIGKSLMEDLIPYAIERILGDLQLLLLLGPKASCCH
ncbi:cyclic GMP-AMP synthase-like receptor [Oculina patagonica]